MVIWSSPARDDLKAIHDYIALDSGFYAERVIEKIIERTGILELFPDSGRIVPEIDDNVTREIFVYSYRIIYEVINNAVYILTVIHSARDLSKIEIRK